MAVIDFRFSIYLIIDITSSWRRQTVKKRIKIDSLSLEIFIILEILYNTFTNIQNNSYD